VIFYSLPEYAEFYSEIVNMLSAETGEKNSSSGVCYWLVVGCLFGYWSAACRGSHMAPDYGCVVDTDGTGGVSCLVLYTQYERMALERIVGAKRCAQMIAGAKATFMFT
jgi:hypothetical protein